MGMTSTHFVRRRLAPQDFTAPNLGEKKANVKPFASSVAGQFPIIQLTGH
jgi:hypothetical protein